MTDQDKKSLTGCLYLGMLLALPLKYLYYGWALSVAWNWFIPQYLGLRNITICEAIGIDLILTFIVTTRIDLDPKSPDRKLEKALMTWMWLAVSPLVMLGVGYIVKSFM